MGTGAAALVAAAVAVVVVTRLWTVLLHLVWRPYAVARAFARQGVRGPPYRVFVGNSKEIQAMRRWTSPPTTTPRA
jgi:PHYB activation tagged suppressor 1